MGAIVCFHREALLDRPATSAARRVGELGINLMSSTLALDATGEPLGTVLVTIPNQLGADFNRETFGALAQIRDEVGGA